MENRAYIPEEQWRKEVLEGLDTDWLRERTSLTDAEVDAISALY